MEHAGIMTDAPDSDDGTVFRDLILLTLLGFVVMVVLMLPHLRPPAADDKSRPTGNVLVFIEWPYGLAADVDLWVRAPGDDPVGYSRSHGAVFDLVRDDLGTSDGDLANFETAASRGLPAGEYVINVHLYSLRVSVLPIEVEVKVTTARTLDEKPVTVAVRTVALLHLKHEVTAVRFTLDADGKLVPGSVHDTPVALR